MASLQIILVQPIKVTKNYLFYKGRQANWNKINYKLSNQHNGATHLIIVSVFASISDNI